MSEYPELEARRTVLRGIKRRLEDDTSYVHLELFMRLRPEVSQIADEAGLSLEQAARIIRTLAEERYIDAELGNATGLYAFTSVKVYDLLDRGRIEIGDLLDPRERLIAGFEKAIEAVREDLALPDEEKERKISLAQQGIAFLRETGSQVLAGLILGG